MRQSRLMSLVEAVANVVVGLLLAVAPCLPDPPSVWRYSRTDRSALTAPPGLGAGAGC